MLKKYKPSKYFSYLYFFIPLILILFINISRESDIWFLLAHGKYVLNNGFPVKEILSLHSDFSFVMQQWLAAGIFYVIYKYLGSLGLYFLVFGVNLLILYFLYKLCFTISKGKRFISVLVSTFIDVLLIFDFIIPRPQIFSILIFVVLLCVLEEYDKKDSKLLYIIPLLSLLLINLHGSVWLCLFVFCAPYVVEYFYLFIKKKDKRIIKLLFVLVLSFMMGFLNPYGYRLMTYAFSSYGISYINEIVGEMSPLNFGGEYFVKVHSYVLLFLFLIMITVMLVSKKRKVSLHALLLMFGTYYMALCNLRNMSFFYTCAIPFICCFLNVKDGEESGKPVVLYVILSILFILIFSVNLYNGKYVLDNDNKEIVKYLEKNTSKEIKLYTNFNDGSYYEYFGYKPYIDSRAEVYVKANNKVEDVFFEYYNLISGKLNVEDFVKKYDFDYFVVAENEYLYFYLTENEQYHLLLNSNGRCLFKKEN